MHELLGALAFIQSWKTSDGAVVRASAFYFSDRGFDSRENARNMIDSSYRRNFDLWTKRTKSITTAGKSILISVKLQRSVANCCTMIFAVLV
jgi:hypothetical protein